MVGRGVEALLGAGGSCLSPFISRVDLGISEQLGWYYHQLTLISSQSVWPRTSEFGPVFKHHHVAAVKCPIGTAEVKRQKTQSTWR